MHTWHMLTLVGKDQTGIVAGITHALFEAGANLGEASMMRLGGNFTMMVMVDHSASAVELERLLAPVAQRLGLRVHVDTIGGELHHHMEPNFSVSVSSADRTGIVARVARALSDAGCHILHLESDVGGSADKPIYIMHIDGYTAAGSDAVEQALAPIKREHMHIHIEALEPMVG